MSIDPAAIQRASLSAAVAPPIASMTAAQMVAVLDAMSEHALSHGANFERASAVAHAGLDIALEWLRAHR